MTTPGNNAVESATVRTAANAILAAESAESADTPKPKKAIEVPQDAPEDSPAEDEEEAGDEPAAEDEEAAGDEPAAEDEEAAGDEPAADDPVEELDIDGEKFRAPKSEHARIKAGVLRQADYTRKTQELAKKQEAADREYQARSAARQAYAEGLKQLQEAVQQVMPKEPDWVALRANDPAEYSRRFADWQLAQAKQQEIADEQRRVADEDRAERGKQHAEHLQRETDLFLAAVPEFKDPVKGPELRRKMYAFAEDLGFSRETVDETSDHRLLVIFNEARLYRELQQKLKSAPKKDIKPVAPVLKPGGNKGAAVTGAKLKARAEAAKIAAKSGRVADAAAAIAMLPD